MEYSALDKILRAGDFNIIQKVLTSQKKERDIKKLKEQWNAQEHSVFDTSKRPDRTVLYEDPDAPEGTTKMLSRIENVNRISVPFQKSIVNKAVSFLFGNPVKLSSDAQTEQELALFGSVEKILTDSKSSGVNRQIARQLFRSTEVAEIWYPISVESHEEYGFPTKFKLRLAIFSPWDGSQLYPYIDDYGDMIAFSREYVVVNEQGKDEQRFEIYTADNVIIWGQSEADWKLISSKENVIKKIPVVYTSQEQAEWEDVQAAIDRLETLLSNHADTNDYNGSPTVVVTGSVLSMGKKGEQGKLLEVEKEGSVDYLSWDHAPESIKMEIENLFRVIYSFTQTPDISFESVKGITSISGIALKLLFMDAHLKVMDKRETFDPYLTRRINIIKAFLGMMNTSAAATIKKLNVNVEIDPFMIADEKERMEILTTAAGGKPVISQRTAVKIAGYAVDDEAEYKQLQKEYDRENTVSITEPTE